MRAPLLGQGRHVRGRRRAAGPGWRGWMGHLMRPPRQETPPAARRSTRGEGRGGAGGAPAPPGRCLRRWRAARSRSRAGRYAGEAQPAARVSASAAPPPASRVCRQGQGRRQGLAVGVHMDPAVTPCDARQSAGRPAAAA